MLGFAWNLLEQYPELHITLVYPSTFADVLDKEIALRQPPETSMARVHQRALSVPESSTKLHFIDSLEFYREKLLDCVIELHYSSGHALRYPNLAVVDVSPSQSLNKLFGVFLMALAAASVLLAGPHRRCCEQDRARLSTLPFSPIHLHTCSLGCQVREILFRRTTRCSLITAAYVDAERRLGVLDSRCCRQQITKSYPRKSL